MKRKDSNIYIYIFCPQFLFYLVLFSELTTGREFSSFIEVTHSLFFSSLLPLLLSPIPSFPSFTHSSSLSFLSTGHCVVHASFSIRTGTCHLPFPSVTSIHPPPPTLLHPPSPIHPPPTTLSGFSVCFILLSYVEYGIVLRLKPALETPSFYIKHLAKCSEV